MGKGKGNLEMIYATVWLVFIAAGAAVILMTAFYPE